MSAETPKTGSLRDPFKPNWKLLESLRQIFINENFSSASYWSNPEVLIQYDYSFGQRIGWKWDAVLHELKKTSCFKGLESVTVIDWGCGTGIASRKFLELVGRTSIQEIILIDKSSLAVQFARESLLGTGKSLSIKTEIPSTIPKKSVLLVSHVLNELTPQSTHELLALIPKVDLVIWVEPGTPAASGKLVQFREALRKQLKVIAPCPHQEMCGLLKNREGSDWCHFFAQPPAKIFHEPFWSEFSRRLQIDLRALPTSFLVMGSEALDSQEKRRVLGRARHYKGYSQALICSSAGVCEEKLLKRESSEVIDIIKKSFFTTWLP